MPPSLPALLAAAILLSPLASPAAAPPWQAMDYGPFLTATVGSTGPGPGHATNLTYKALAVNLGGQPHHQAAILFDTDLLRYSVGWTGNFVALKGVVFDGEHWAYPLTDGPAAFANPMAPGWARPGTRDFTDTRSEPFGPLPRDWAAWKGVHVQGSNVVFEYRVGDMTVLDHPGIAEIEGHTFFVRDLELGPSSAEQVLQVLQERGRAAIALGASQGSDARSLPATDGSGVWLQAPMVKTAAKALAPPVEGLLGWWSFDGPEAETLPDQSGAGRVLRLEGPRVTPSGRTAQGLAFQPRQRAALDGAAELDFARHDLTIAAWIQTRQDGGIFAKTSPDPQWVPGATALFIRNGRLTFDVGWVGAVASSRTVADGDWHHVALTWRAADGQAALYLDGQADGSARLKPGKALTNHVARVGFVAPNFPATPWFTGILDDLRLYRRTLSPVEVASLVGPEPRDTTAPAVAVTGAPPGSRWLTEGEDGHVRLVVPPHAVPARLKLVTGRGPENTIPDVTVRLARASTPRDLRALTEPGPARWTEKLTTQGRTTSDDGPYAIDELTAPDANPWHAWLRFSGLDFFQDGRRAAVSTWNGDVWLVDGINGSLERLTWQRIASGLFQPLGLKIVDEEIYVLGRDQITRLQDLNGDGETDFYENFHNDTRVSEHFHEFATDLKQGPDGDFYYVKCARHALPAAHSQHGTLIRVSRDGQRSEILARGFRAVNGLGVGPRGEFTTVDNQGHWMPANRINWVKPDGWYGNQWAWNPDQRTTYDEPLCWVHNFVDRSGGTHLWVPDERWGLQKDDLITLSYGMGHLFLILNEEIDGVRQGALTRLPLDFETGVMRGVFHPGNGALYACGLYGWAGNRTKPGGLYRIRRTERPLHLVREFHVAQDGLVLGFTQPLSPSSATDPGNYDLKAWNYRWSAQYGSPDLRLNGSEGRDTWQVTSATLSADRRTVFLRVPEIQRVMQIHLVFKLRAEDGNPVENFVHGTIHRTGGDSGLAQLGAGTIDRVVSSDTRIEAETPGLREGLFVGEETAPRDVRTARLAAFHLPPGAPPSPFVPAGPLRIRWEGWLKLDLNESKRFILEGRGNAHLRINGTEALAAAGDPLPNRPSAPVPLRQGWNRFELDYHPPATGAAEFRLLWSGESHPTEPVPPTAFVHDGSEGLLRKFNDLRAGRTLFAENQCAACHQPATPWEDGSMPELAATAPAFDALGDRLLPGWIARWLLDPRATRPDARMPAMLHGTTAPKDAQDIAAYLSSLHGQSSVPPRNTTSADIGLSLYRELGCAGCHTLAGEPTPSLQPRPHIDTTQANNAHTPAAAAVTSANAPSPLPLNSLRDKWRPGALAAYLKAPTRNHPWSRMPDFQLTEAEASALATLLESRANAPTLAHPIGDSASIRRGAELTARLGCLRCHALEGAKDTSRAADLTAIARADGLRGCLATNPRDRRTAPLYPFKEVERTLLREFLKAEPDRLLRRDSPTEFATRQYDRLQCQACHARDHQVDRLAALEPTPPAGVTDDEEGAEGGSVHVGRPVLTHTGEKLHAPWVERLLSGTLGYKPRSDLQGRMPAFPAYAAGLAAGFAHQHGYPATAAERLEVIPDLAEVGRRLTLVEGGFSCVSCHGVGRQKALAGKDTATVNFTHVAERLRHSYYWRYVQDPPRVMPGTMMPKFIGDDGRTALKSVFDGDPRRQFEALWHYLHALSGQPTADR